MPLKLTIRPVGSFLVVTADVRTEMPDLVDARRRIWSNQYCVTVGTLVDVDGPTHLTVSKDADEKSELEEVFDGIIVTPEKTLTISDAHLNVFSTINTSGEKTRIRVFSNDPREPDDVLILVLPAT